MSFRFEAGEPVEHGVHRMVREQIDKAIGEIDDPDLDRHDAVHQVRKRCKKVRALARIVRGSLGGRYREFNVHFRDIARPLSAVRDAHAMVETFDEVTENHTDDRDLSVVREALVARRDGLAPRSQLEELLIDAREALVEGRNATTRWRVEGSGFDAVADGVGRVYERGRDAMDDALEDPSPERYHEWRKRAKYLWYHVRVLRPLWPDPMKALRDETDRLADVLGDDHDTWVAHAIVEAEPALGTVDGMGTYLDLLARRSERLRAEATVLGARVHAESSKRFVARLRAYDAADDVLG